MYLRNIYSLVTTHNLKHGMFNVESKHALNQVKISLKIPRKYIIFALIKICNIVQLNRITREDNWYLFYDEKAIVNSITHLRQTYNARLLKQSAIISKAIGFMTPHLKRYVSSEVNWRIWISVMVSRSSKPLHQGHKTTLHM